ncbi:MAG: protein kinase [Planctomycetota bacterium]
MTENCSHPSKEELNAYSLGQLPEDAAVAIDSHISECQTCCETIVDLSSEDTFAALLLESEKSRAEPTLEHEHAASNSPQQDLPTVLAEHPRYEVLSLIGRGGMGDVYKARHRKMDRTVALKVINRQVVRKQEAIDRFHREVKTAAKLSHPNIVTSHDADQAGEFHFLAMEYVDGIDLAQTIKQRGALPITEACDYVRQAAIGLQYAHERGMVHRDIKPHNLIVTEDGTVKILDFGLASLAPANVLEGEIDDSHSDLTVAGAIMGTPDFISPEQASYARLADTRSDIYSLGATLYFLLSGRVPFDEGSVMHKLKSHAELEPESLSLMRGDLPESLLTIVSRMMAKDPADRYQSAEEVATALSEFTTQPSFAEPPNRRGRSLLKWAGGMALFAAATVALCMFLFGPHDPEADYKQMSQFMQTGNSEEPVGDVMARLLRTEEGRKLLRKLDAEYPKFAYTSGDFARGYTSVAILGYENRVTGVREAELMLKGWSPTTTGMATRNIVRAFDLQSIRFDNAGDATCKAIVRYKTPENPKLTLGLKPNSIYQTEIRLNDFIEGKKSIVDLFAGGDFQKDLSMQGFVADAQETSTKSESDLAGGNVPLPPYTPKAPVIELRWAFTKHIPGITHPTNRGNYQGNTYYSLEPVLTLTSENVASAKYFGRKLPPSGDAIQHWVQIKLDEQALSFLDKQMLAIKADQITADKVQYLALMIDDEVGFSATPRLGKMGDYGFTSPHYRNAEKAHRIIEALRPAAAKPDPATPLADSTSAFVPDKPIDNPYERIQGHWQVQSQISNGVGLNQEFPGYTAIQGLQIDGVIDRQEDVAGGRFRLGLVDGLTTIDVRGKNGEIARGIYEFKGDALRLCFSESNRSNRPKSFTSTANSRTTVTAFQRTQNFSRAPSLRILGKWKVKEGVVNGEKLPTEETSYVTFTKDSVRVDFNKDVAVLDFQFADENKNPLEINLIDAGDQLLLGICELGDDTMQLCVRNVGGIERPTDFAEPGEKTTLVKLERVP